MKPLLTTLLLAAWIPVTLGAQIDQLPRAYPCTNISGSIMTAPNWKPEPDGARGQELLLNFGGDKELAEVKWTSGGTTYYEAAGIGVAMPIGFSVVVFAD